MGEQIYFLEPASNIWKNRRKVLHYNAWFENDKEHSKMMSEKDHVL